MEEIAPPDSVEHPWKLTFIVKGPIRRWNQPSAVLEKAGRQELVEGSELAPASCSLIAQAKKSKHDLISSLLENTAGGFLKYGVQASGPIAYSNNMGFPTTAFVGREACSFGGTLVMTCAHRVTLGNSKIHFHQPFLLSENEADLENFASEGNASLAFPRHQFRSQLVNWLKNNTSPEHTGWVLARTFRAFRDSENHLDDVTFKGWELKVAGIVERAVKRKASLAKAYALHSKSKPEQWHPKIQEFFT